MRTEKISKITTHVKIAEKGLQTRQESKLNFFCGRVENFRRRRKQELRKVSMSEMVYWRDYYFSWSGFYVI